jgi:hypothetical protein
MSGSEAVDNKELSTGQPQPRPVTPPVTSVPLSEPVQVATTAMSNDRYESMQPRLKKFLKIYQLSSRNSLNGPSQNDLDQSLNSTTPTPTTTASQSNNNNNNSLDIIANVAVEAAEAAAAAAAAAVVSAATANVEEESKNPSMTTVNSDETKCGDEVENAQNENNTNKKPLGEPQEGPTKIQSSSSSTSSSSSSTTSSKDKSSLVHSHQRHHHHHHHHHSHKRSLKYSQLASGATVVNRPPKADGPTSSSSMTVGSLLKNNNNNNHHQGHSNNSYLKCLQVDTDTSSLAETLLHGERITCFVVGGEKRLCLHDILNTILRDFSVQQINNACQKLQIACLESTSRQLDILKRHQLLPVGAPNCGLLTLSNAERLCAFLMDAQLGQAARPTTPPTTASPSLSPSKKATIKVVHECFGKTYGHLHTHMYSRVDSACVECDTCRRLYTPSNFVCHTHKYEAHTRHWGFDSANWRLYLKLASGQQQPVAQTNEQETTTTTAKSNILNDIRNANKDNIAANGGKINSRSTSELMEEFEMFKQKFTSGNHQRLHDFESSATTAASTAGVGHLRGAHHSQQQQQQSFQPTPPLLLPQGILVPTPVPLSFKSKEFHHSENSQQHHTHPHSHPNHHHNHHHHPINGTPPPNYSTKRSLTDLNNQLISGNSNSSSSNHHVNGGGKSMTTDAATLKSNSNCSSPVVVLQSNCENNAKNQKTLGSGGGGGGEHKLLNGLLSKPLNGNSANGHNGTNGHIATPTGQNGSSGSSANPLDVSCSSSLTTTPNR